MKLRQITFGAVIAAVYAALTLVLAPISMGAVQCRISEALTVLPLFTPVAIPGLFVGCLIANIFLGSVYDIVFGSLTTLAAAFLTWKCRKNKYIAMLFPVVLNAVIVGGYIALFLDASMAVWLSMTAVGLGQAVACYGLGLPLCKILEKFFERKSLQ